MLKYCVLMHALVYQHQASYISPKMHASHASSSQQLYDKAFKVNI